MTMKLDGTYDQRKAEKLKTAKKKTPDKRLSDKDFAELKNQADAISRQVANGTEAKLVSYHKRRKRSRWLIADKIYEVVLKMGLIVITLLKVFV